mgnify:CR=1 FL=1
MTLRRWNLLTAVSLAATWQSSSWSGPGFSGAGR